MNIAASDGEFWRSRLFVPNYRIREAAKYADIAPQTVSSWHSRPGANRKSTLSSKEQGAALSYLQLIEVAVVASFRKAGVTLKKIKTAREYLSKQLEVEHPFAQYRFKTDGKELWMDYAQLHAPSDKTLMAASLGGQLAWTDIIGRLQEFEYDTETELAIQWRVAGESKSILIDPRIQFGAPAIDGIATWVFKGRWQAGEPIDEIADDFGVPNSAVLEALEFEGINVEGGRPTRH